MPEPISPIVSGLMNAFNLANMIHTQRAHDQQIALEERRVQYAEHAQQQREEHEQTQLDLQLQAGHYRPETPSDELEAQTGERYDVDSRLSSQPTTAPDGLPQRQATVTPQLKTAKSDIATRTVKVRGQKYVRESDQEREARLDQENTRATARKRTAEKDDLVEVPMPEAMRKPGGPATVWLPKSQLAHYTDVYSNATPADTPAEYQALGGPKRVPFKNLPQVIATVAGQRRAKDTADAAAKRATDQRTFQAGENEKTRTFQAGEKSKDRASRVEAAGVRAGAQADTQQSIADRQEAGFIERGKEADLHTRRHKLREQLHTGKDDKDQPLKKGAMTLMQADIKGVTDEIQGLQLRKAKLYKIKVPPPDILNGIQEGTEGPGPDGHIWYKKDGIVYVK